MSSLRVRFAPSPTGFLHLGAVRSALFDWLLAQNQGGQFILRIEDTDRERLVEGAVEDIKASLRWLGLEWNEGPDIGGSRGPYTQSERLEIYRQHAKSGVDQGFLYPCWCSEQRLGKLREQAQQAKKPFKYDRYCLDQPQNLNQPHVLRFKVPAGQQIAWYDAVFGQLEFQYADQDDFVAVKSDGFPTYNFANVIDDNWMQISHVLRGEEFISSTPKHLMLYQAYGWQPPVFAHLPQVLGTDKAKLSKRHGAKPVLDYRDEGYLPEAIINFLALLGWNEGEGTTQEIYGRQDLIKAFSLQGINASPAVFDPNRLDWFNGKYIRSLTHQDLANAAEPFWPPPAKTATYEYKLAVLELVKERLVKLSQLPVLTEFFFADPKPGTTNPQTTIWLDLVYEAIAESSFEPEQLETVLRGLASQHNIGAGQLFGAIRLAVTGQSAAPGLFATLAVLGREASLRRIKAAIGTASD